MRARLYLREIMDCPVPGTPVERVVLNEGAQVGGTELGLNWVGYAIHHAPGPMMMSGQRPRWRSGTPSTASIP